MIDVDRFLGAPAISGSTISDKDKEFPCEILKSECLGFRTREKRPEMS